MNYTPKIIWSVLLLALTASTHVFAQDSPPKFLPSGQVGVLYEYQLQVSGGTGPLTWRQIAGILPNKVILEPSSGKLKGTPDVARPEPYEFTIEVEDSSPIRQKFQMRLALPIRSSMYIVPPSQASSAAVTARNAGPSAEADATPTPTPAQSNSDKVSITVSDNLANPKLYFEDESSKLKKGTARNLINDTLRTRETFESGDYCIVHAVRWTNRAGKFESDDHWYLFRNNKVNKEDDDLWESAPLEQNDRLLGVKRIAILLVHLEAEPEWDIKYDVSVTEKTPQNITNLMTLLGVVSPAPGGEKKETLPSRWGGKLLKDVPKTSELAFSGKVTFLQGEKQSQDAQSFAKNYTNEGRSFWDVSVGFQLKATEEVKYNAADGTVRTSKEDRQNAFGMLNFFPGKVDVRGDEHNFLRTTHFFVGVPISGKPLDNPIAGMGFGIYRTPLKVNLFAGITFTKVRDPKTLGVGESATQAALESDFRIHRVHKFIFGIDFPISQIKDALKKK